MKYTDLKIGEMYERVQSDITGIYGLNSYEDPRAKLLAFTKNHVIIEWQGGKFDKTEGAGEVEWFLRGFKPTPEQLTGTVYAIFYKSGSVDFNTYLDDVKYEKENCLDQIKSILRVDVTSETGRFDV